MNTPRQSKSTEPSNLAAVNWIPSPAITYLTHTQSGVSMRSLARDQGCHASTIHRQVQKYENLRDDPLIDDALNLLAKILPISDVPMERTHMTNDKSPKIVSDTKVTREARRILRRLCENGAYLLISPNMDVAAVFKESVNATPTRIAVVERQVAHAFGLKEWISGEQLGKVGKYTITSTGRKALKRMLAQEGGNANVFQSQHQVFADKSVKAANGPVEKLRINLAESPLALLARKKDKGGVSFLTHEMLVAGERLREDFEQAQLGPRVTQNWDRFLTNTSSGWNPNAGSNGPTGARDRVSGAMRALGPGLGDVALRVCCFLEGLEKAERRLGWSARSGKVVLKIALQRLADHYGIAAPEMQKVG